MRALFEQARPGADGLSAADLAEAIGITQRLVNVASAVQGLRIAQYAAWDVADQPGQREPVPVEHPVGHVRQFAGDDLAPMLAMSPATAGRKVRTAATWAAKLPATMAAMGRGDLDPWRATCIAFELEQATAATCASVEALVFPQVTADTPRAATKRVRTALAKVDADVLRVKAAKARLSRFVKTYPNRDVPGMTDWLAMLPSAESAACRSAIEGWRTGSSVTTRT